MKTETTRKQQLIPSNEDRKIHKEWKKKKAEERNRIIKELEKDEYEQLSNYRRRDYD